MRAGKEAEMDLTSWLKHLPWYFQVAVALGPIVAMGIGLAKLAGSRLISRLDRPLGGLAVIAYAWAIWIGYKLACLWTAGIDPKNKVITQAFVLVADAVVASAFLLGSIIVLNQHIGADGVPRIRKGSWLYTLLDNLPNDFRDGQSLCATSWLSAVSIVFGPPIVILRISCSGFASLFYAIVLLVRCFFTLENPLPMIRGMSWDFFPNDWPERQQSWTSGRPWRSPALWTELLIIGYFMLRQSAHGLDSTRLLSWAGALVGTVLLVWGISQWSVLKPKVCPIIRIESDDHFHLQ